MHFKVTVKIENCETKVFREAERTITLHAGTSPIDFAEQERMLRWSVNEATEEALRERL